nr:chemotaxis response regulator protein-glutamate methylesterase [Hansschlegelia beijingensis]
MEIGLAERVRVMIVDDSVVARNLTSRWLQDEPGLDVVTTCRSGREAVESIAWARPDVVVLDVEMPEMDGVEALPLLLRAKPGLAVVMASSYTTRGADLSLRCLALGAMDVLAKPSRDQAQSEEYRRELLSKVRALGEVAWRRSAAASRVANEAAALARYAARSVRAGAAAWNPVRALAIGSSTGGPQALSAVLKAVGPVAGRVPVLVTQHMPVGFTAALANHLAAASGVPAREAEDGEPLKGGAIYVAPGGKHFSVARSGAQAVARVEDGPPVNFCKPSVDPLFRSAAEVYGPGLLAVVLTGMGSDGASAAPVVAAAGGRVFAQDEASSVVWGMPGAAVATGACSAVLPLSEMGPRIARAIVGERS